MSNYTKTTNFASKDNLSPGNPLKIVKGTEIDTEFNNIQTAVGTKTDNASANITGGTIVGITDLAVADGGTGASTAAGALNNLLPSQTSNANKYLQTDGTNATWDAVSLSTSDITGTLAVANGGTGVTTSTGTGAVVLSNSPTLVTPALGTPASGTATNLTGLPISTGVSGLGTGVATFLGTPSSANLASAVTDETGSGALVFANSPTLVTPALGTPSALVGTNITGTASGLTAGNVTTNANLTGAVTSVGNATSLGSFSSANLLGALTDETGTGSAVFATSPTLVTPILGTPTSATLTNATGLPLSTGVTGTLPVANGGTGTATPSIVAGTNVTVTGTWPNQTIAASGSSGTVTSVAVSGGTTGLTTSGGPVTTSGTITLAGTLAVANGGTGVTSSTGSGNAVLSTSPTLVTPILGTPTSGTLTNATGLPLSTGVTGTLPVANGGTGQTSYTDGQLLIGNSTGNTLTKATLTAGTNVTITNAAGAITIAASGGGASAATPTALGTVYGSMTTTTEKAFIGYQAGNSNSGGDSNNAHGYRALYVLTSGYNNNAFGTSALESVVTGITNSAFGTGALRFTTGNANSGFGDNALYTNTSGASNSSLGYRSLYSNTTGNSNTSIGHTSLYSCTTGFDNSVLGKEAGYNITTGGANICIGSASGQVLSTGLRNIHIGYLTNGSSSSVSDEMHISTGSSTTGKGGSTGFINPNGGSLYQGNNTTTFATISDRRLKKNIVDNNTGLEKLTQIQVRNFEYRLAEEITELPQAQAIQKSGVQLGVIAQELQAVLPECVKQESTGVLRVDADNLTWYMINAIKELKAEFDAYKATHP